MFMSNMNMKKPIQTNFYQCHLQVNKESIQNQGQTKEAKDLREWVRDKRWARSRKWVRNKREARKDHQNKWISLKKQIQ